MERHRIKTVTYKNGRKEIFAQKKVLFGWNGLLSNGDTCEFDALCDTRKEALDKIDLNFYGNVAVQKIDFEYINE